jgi:hypothetical protein
MSSVSRAAGAATRRAPRRRWRCRSAGPAGDGAREPAVVRRLRHRGEGQARPSPEGGLHQGRPNTRRVRVIARAATRAGDVRRARLARGRGGLTGSAVREPEGRADDCSLDGQVHEGTLRGRRDNWCVVAQRAANIDHASRGAGRRPQGDRGDRGAHQHSHDGDVRRGEPAAARPHTAGGDVVTPMSRTVLLKISLGNCDDGPRWQ